jgi:uncharacterized C2H2 Zn-finger protein
MNEEGGWVLKCPFCGKGCEKTSIRCGAVIKNINEFDCGDCKQCVYLNLEDYGKHLKDVHNQ